MDRNALAINRQRSIINNALARKQMMQDPSEIGADQGRAILDGLWNFGGGAQNGNETGIAGKLLSQIGLDASGQRSAQPLPDAIANTAHAFSPESLYGMAQGVYGAGNRLMSGGSPVTRTGYDAGELTAQDQAMYTPEKQALDAFGIASALPAGGLLARAPEGAVGSNALRKEGRVNLFPTLDQGISKVELPYYKGTGEEKLWASPDTRKLYFGSDNPTVASSYATKDGAVERGVMRFENPYTFDANGSHWGDLNGNNTWIQPEDIARQAREAGHDGIIIKNIDESHIPGSKNVPQSTTYAALKRGTVFDDHGNLLFSNSSDPTTAATTSAVGSNALRREAPTLTRSVDPLGYYSQALESAKTLQAKGTPEQMLAQLRNSGVKQAEIDATNLPQFLDGKKSITRDEIAAHLEQNRVRPKEVTYAPPDYEALNNVAQMYHGEDFDYLSPRQQRIIKDEIGASSSNVKWQSHSLDPSNPTYRETVLHLPANSAELTVVQHPEGAYRGFALQRPDGSYVTNGVDSREPAAWSGRRGAEMAAQNQSTRSTLEDFRSGHFPEPNIIGHMMTSLNEVPGRGKAFTLDQIQSDWGQKLRDGGVRDEAKIADLKQKIENAKKLALENPPKGVDDESWLVLSGERNIAFSKSIQSKIDQNEVRRISAELRTAEASSPGHPLVNTTDQWTNTTLRRAVQQAVEADADHIAIPSGKTVLGYNPGDEHGMETFYNSIVPKNLHNILKKLDPQTQREFVDQLQTPSGLKGQGFTMFPLTETAKENARKGLPLFSNPNDPTTAATTNALSRDALKRETPSFTAYHGSPHDFDKFSLDKIGTGEGAQAYGHGLYFAENEGVAKGHRARFGDAQAGGRMYQVRINADPEHFLDWDKPLSQQSERVKDAFPNELQNLAGGDAHQELAQRFLPKLPPDPAGTPKGWGYVQRGDEGQPNVTKALREAGIPGIKYLDQGSRAIGEGTRNYVVFDDKIIDIVKKYGIAAAAALYGMDRVMQAQDAQAAPTDTPQNALARRY